MLLRQVEKSWRNDPEVFVTEHLHEVMWSKQREVLRAVRDHRRVAVPSSHDVGKSWLASRAVAWWLSGGDLGESFAVTTAPTASQVRAILWREIARAYRQGKLPGRINQTEWFMRPDGLRYRSPSDGEELVAYGRKPSDYDESAFQGIHARRVLVVIDEACGVPLDLWTAADTLISGGDSKILAIGNPDDPHSEFARICRPNSGWHVIHIDGLESPNFTSEHEHLPKNLLAQLLSPEWVGEKRAEWGEQSPLFVSKVRGQFPEDTEDTVVLLSWVRKCQLPKDYDDLEDAQEGQEAAHDKPVELGVDVGAGGDETVIRERRGMKAGRTWRKKTPDWAEAMGLVMNAIRETGATRVKVDVIGIGWGVVGGLQEKARQGEHTAEIIGVSVAEKAQSPTRFPKLRDEIWWEVGRELSRTGEWDLSEVDDTTISQLVAPTYSLDSSGRISVEKKDELRSRIGRSPDDADALLLAFYGGGKPKKEKFMGGWVAA